MNTEPMKFYVFPPFYIMIMRLTRVSKCMFIDANVLDLYSPVVSDC